MIPFIGSIYRIDKSIETKKGRLVVTRAWVGAGERVGSDC